MCTYLLRAGQMRVCFPQALVAWITVQLKAMTYQKGISQSVQNLSLISVRKNVLLLTPKHGSIFILYNVILLQLVTYGLWWQVGVLNLLWGTWFSVTVSLLSPSMFNQPTHISMCSDGFENDLGFQLKNIILLACILRKVLGFLNLTKNMKVCNGYILKNKHQESCKPC